MAVRQFAVDVGSAFGITAPAGQRDPIGSWVSAADMLFAALDHHLITSAGGDWVTEVMGVHLDEHEAWVQVSALENTHQSVVLRMSPVATVQQALDALERWSSRSEDERLVSRILEVGFDAGRPAHAS
jgi:hypothetical protein